MSHTSKSLTTTFKKKYIDIVVNAIPAWSRIYASAYERGDKKNLFLR